MIKNTNNNQDGRALCSERYTTNNMKTPKSRELVSAVDDTNNAKLLNQRDNTVFKTDLSKFYSSTPLSVVPAVQSGQNIIPAMVKTRRSTFFWNTEKHGWSKVKDDALVKPNIVRNWNTEEDQGNIVLLSKERSRNIGIKQCLKDEKNIIFPRLKRSNRRKHSSKRRVTTFRNAINIEEAHKNAEVSGVLKNIRIASPLMIPKRQMTCMLNHPIKIHEKPFELSDAISTPFKLDGSMNDLDGKSKTDMIYVRADRTVDAEGDGSPSSPSTHQVCWRCQAKVSPGSWHPHKWQKDNFLCSSCFSFFKKKGKKSSMVTPRKKSTLIN